MNRQRYMAELSKLLTFMFKEDKEDILAHYNKMLDEAEDEQALLESFGSPTRLAVNISRGYKRAERKLAVEADSKADKPDEGETSVEPEHIFVKPVKKESAAEKTPAAPAPGLSYADIIEEIRREKAEEEGVEYTPMFFNEPEKAPTEPEAEEKTEESEPVTEEFEAEEAEEADIKVEIVETPSEESEPEETEIEEEAPEADGESDALEEPAEEAEADETVAENAEVSEETTEDEEAEEVETVEETVKSGEGEEPPAAEEIAELDAVTVFDRLDKVQPPEETVQYKTNVGLLILYLIFAIPIGLALFFAAVIVAISLLAAGAVLIGLGIKTVGFAFSTFAIFADSILCAGAALVALAVALMLIWLAILILFRGLSGLIAGIKALGGRICVREVTVNE